VGQLYFDIWFYTAIVAFVLAAIVYPLAFYFGPREIEKARRELAARDPDQPKNTSASA
jgi:hypothetical protein